jgi:hypothetical protein
MSKNAAHRSFCTWQVFVMGPVIGNVNAGASIVKAMLVTDASIHYFDTPFAWHYHYVEMWASMVPSCEVPFFTAGPADGARAHHAERPGEPYRGRARCGAGAPAGG